MAEKEGKKRKEGRKLLKTITLCYVSSESQPSWPNEIRVRGSNPEWAEV